MADLIRDRVRYEVQNAIARITLARPDAGNSLDLAMAEAIRDAAERVRKSAEAGELRAVLLQAEGRVFCVGGDLRDIAGQADRGAHLRAIAGAVHDGIRLLAEAPVPVVAAVGGTAAGGGVGVALAADIVVASTKARFAMAYTAAGLSPDCGTSWLLARRVGTARALDLALTNRPLSAEEAAQWGLLSRVVDPEQLTPEVDGIVAALAMGPRQAQAETKRLIRKADTVDLNSHLDDEAASISTLAATADGREGVDAFLGKRKPQFAG